MKMNDWNEMRVAHMYLTARLTTIVLRILSAQLLFCMSLEPVQTLNGKIYIYFCTVAFKALKKEWTMYEMY